MATRASPPPQPGAWVQARGRNKRQWPATGGRAHAGSTQPVAQSMRCAVGADAATGFEEGVERMPLRLCARFEAGISGNRGETVPDAVIRPAVVAALNELLHGEEE